MLFWSLGKIGVAWVQSCIHQAIAIFIIYIYDLLSRGCIHLVKQWNRIGTVAAVRVTTWLKLRKYAVIFQVPSVFSTGQVDEPNRDMVGTTSMSFKFLIVAQIPAILPGLCYSLVNYFTRERKSSRLPQGFPCDNDPHFTDQAAYVGIRLVTMSISNMPSQTGAMTTRWV